MKLKSKIIPAYLHTDMKNLLVFPLIIITTCVFMVSGLVFQKTVSADLCIGIIACSAIAGNGGNGGDANAGDVGEGGSCYAKIIGDSCGGSTGSTEPRGGAGGNGGDAVIGNSDHDGGKNETETEITSN